jgi:acetyl esterase/lipase
MNSPSFQAKFLAIVSACVLAAGICSFAVDAPVPDDVVFERAVEFANPDNQHLQVDVASPKNGSGPFPAIVCIHGGGFRAGKREGYDNLCIKFAQQGFVAITVTYRLAPAYPFPAAVHD